MTGFDETMAAFDRDHLWHPYSAMNAADAALPVVAARGVHLQLADGRRLVDGTSSWWAAIHGYNHPAINDAVALAARHLNEAGGVLGGREIQIIEADGETSETSR